MIGPSLVQRAVLVAMLATVVAGCARGQAVIRPPEIKYGADLCSQCNMIISDVRFAAAYVYEVEPGRYESAAFDDIGDLLAHAGQHPEREIVAWYVHDYGTEEWLDASAAHYVQSAALETPMGSGTAAFGMAEAAEQAATELDGQVLDWAGLLALHQAGISPE